MDRLTRQVSDINEEDDGLWSNVEEPVKWRSDKDGAKKLFSKEDLDHMKEHYKCSGRYEYRNSDEFCREIDKIKNETRRKALQEAQETIANSLQNAGFAGGAVNMVRNNIKFI